MPEPSSLSKRQPPVALREQRAAANARAVETDKDPETIRRIWETKKDLVLLADEHTRLKAGLDLLKSMETSPGSRFEEVPGLVEAEELVDAFGDTYPGTPKLDLLQLVRQHLDQTLRTEIEGARNEGLPVPTAQEVPTIREFLEVETDTQRILKGLDDMTKDPPPPTRERARAQHFMAEIPTDNPQFARAQANQRLRLKKAELKKAGILVP